MLKQNCKSRKKLACQRPMKNSFHQYRNTPLTDNDLACKQDCTHYTQTEADVATEPQFAQNKKNPTMPQRVVHFKDFALTMLKNTNPMRSLTVEALYDAFQNAFPNALGRWIWESVNGIAIATYEKQHQHANSTATKPYDPPCSTRTHSTCKS